MADSKRTGLGRGLGSLIPETLDATALITDNEHVRQLAITKVLPNPEQPRTVFDEAALRELASSISRYGVLQPLVVMPKGSSFVIIAGERRYRASKLAGLRTVPALVRTSEELEQLEIALVENVQRVDLGPLEQAVSIERLHQQFNLAYAEIAKRLGKAETTVSNIVRLLQLPDDARAALLDKKISEGHARQILALKNQPRLQQILLNQIITSGWSVRQAERYVNSVKAGHVEPKKTHARMAAETPETKRLTQRYGVPVSIRRTAKGGRVEIAFKSDEELKRLLAALADRTS